MTAADLEEIVNGRMLVLNQDHDDLLNRFLSIEKAFDSLRESVKTLQNQTTFKTRLSTPQSAPIHPFAVKMPPINASGGSK